MVAEVLPLGRLRGVVRLRSEGLLRNGVWALADQMLISATNFVTMVLLARNLNSQDFGSFSLVYLSLMFAGNLQTALVTRPHNVLGVARHAQAYSRYTSSVAAGQVLLACLLALLSLVSAVVAHYATLGVAPLLFALAPAIVAWQLQEFVRRVLYTEQRLAAAFANDLISYGGQAAAIVVLLQLENLTGATALYVLAGTSALAAAWGFWQIRSGLGRGFERRLLSDNWTFGKWLLGAEVASWTSGQLYPVLAAGLVNVSAAGAMRAVSVVMGPTNVLLKAMEAGFTPRAARAYATGGSPALRRFIARTTVTTAPFMIAYCLLVGVFASPVLHLLYADQYGRYGWLLTVLSLSYLLVYSATLASIALLAKEVSVPFFHANLWSSVMVLTLGVAAVRGFGLEGAALGMVMHQLIKNVVLWRRHWQEEKES